MKYKNNKTKIKSNKYKLRTSDLDSRKIRTKEKGYVNVRIIL